MFAFARFFFGALLRHALQLSIICETLVEADSVWDVARSPVHAPSSRQTSNTTDVVDLGINTYEGVDVLSEVGSKVNLPCPVNPGDCGQVHSIKWYKDSHRIFVFSEAAHVSRPEPGYADRIELDYTKNKSDSWLVIKSAVVEDEGVYRCEITYVEVSDTCQAVHQLNFTTLIRPESITAYREGGDELDNGTVISGITEGEEISLLCKSGPAKPIPLVQWWNGSYLVSDGMEVEEIGGIGTGKASLKMVVSRSDLGVDYQCRAYHPSFQDTGYILISTSFDVAVLPMDVKISGLDGPVISGNRVELECVVADARPPANITWYNGTSPMGEPSNHINKQTDGTYDTISRLTFTATRHDYDKQLTCEATSSIMIARGMDPLRQTTFIHVMYPPIVTVSPENITVNESADVLMFCEYIANPANLMSVKWMRDDVEIDLNSSHYKGGSTSQTSLLIRNATRTDMGNYTCLLANEVGEMPSENFVYVSIYFKPETRVRLEPPSPAIASPDVNVTLTCEVEAGNPTLLTHVRWFLDGESIASLPNCTNSTFCGLNPSQVFLHGISTSFHGNWTCKGKNGAGWGPISPKTELAVFYPPSGTHLSYIPKLVVKRRPMTLYCSVKDRGRPNNTTFRWSRGGLTVTDVTSANYTIQSVTLASETNFTCRAVNLGGQSEPVSVFIKVHAPPTFIKRLPLYFGALMTSENINMTCRVECSPICSIMWLKNGRRLETGHHARYYVENRIIPPDTRTNDFESVQSTLVWNMTSWPGGQLDRVHDNANYTCYSTGNTVGPGVRSSTFFGVEYPPEELIVSTKVLNVNEGHVPEKVLCSAKAYPEASYQWRREGEADIVIKGSALLLNHPFERKNGGNYICEAYNKHGNSSQKTYINVLYKPECGIIKKEVEGKLVLECSALANPDEVDFTWKIKNENDTVDERIEKIGFQSILTLETRIESSRTYLCFANNSVGISEPCAIDVTGTEGWWGRIENENFKLIFAVITGFIFMFVVVSVTVFLTVFKKKARGNKYPSSNKGKKNTLTSDALLPADSSETFYENLSFHNLQSTPNKRAVKSECEKRHKPRRKTPHHGSCREVNGLSSREDYHKYMTTPYNCQNGSPPRSAHHRPHHRTRHTRSRNHTEYSFMKFHDGEQEIDV